MSVNDILNDDDFLPIMLAVFIVLGIIAVPFAIISNKKANKKVYGGDNHSIPIHVERDVKIVSKGTVPHPLNVLDTVNTVVFEFTNGYRLDLAIKDPYVYNILKEGDCGTLKYQGIRFVSFERNLF